MYSRAGGAARGRGAGLPPALPERRAGPRAAPILPRGELWRCHGATRPERDASGVAFHASGAECDTKPPPAFSIPLTPCGRVVTATAHPEEGGTLMQTIQCTDCAPLGAFKKDATGNFRCIKCGAVLMAEDIDLDTPYVWGVDKRGLLVSVVAPMISVEMMCDALEDLRDPDVPTSVALSAMCEALRNSSEAQSVEIGPGQ